MKLGFMGVVASLAISSAHAQEAFPGLPKENIEQACRKDASTEPNPQWRQSQIENCIQSETKSLTDLQAIWKRPEASFAKEKCLKDLKSSKPDYKIYAVIGLCIPDTVIEAWANGNFMEWPDTAGPKFPKYKVTDTDDKQARGFLEFQWPGLPADVRKECAGGDYTRGKDRYSNMLECTKESLRKHWIAGDVSFKPED